MSLTIAVRFLTGYCVAARSKTDARPEWPPHPEKLFLALAAAYFEWDRDDAERAALQWLESLPAPTIRFTDRAVANDAVGTYVPANDPKSVRQGGTIQTVPSLKRHRAERMFPRTHLPPERDTVYFTWAADEIDSTKHRPALTALCGRVGRFGHSSSFTHVYLADPATVAAEATLVPDDQEPLSRLRVVARSTGTLQRLERDYQTPPFRPSRSIWRGYLPLKPALPAGAATTVFSDRLMIFELKPRDSSYRQLDVSASPQLCSLTRAAVQRQAGAPGPSISGHLPGGRPIDRAHVAYAALPFIAHGYADGRLMGMAVILPRSMPRDEQQQLSRALAAIADRDEVVGEGLHNDRLGEWSLALPDPAVSPARTLEPAVWTGGTAGSLDWATVTPIALDRHSAARDKHAYRDECIASITDSVRAVLSDPSIPVAVELADVSPFYGAPSAATFPRLQRKDGSKRRQLHAVIHFGKPVTGPLLIGAGRYRGYGLCRPYRWETER